MGENQIEGGENAGQDVRTMSKQWRCRRGGAALPRGWFGWLALHYQTSYAVVENMS